MSRLAAAEPAGLWVDVRRADVLLALGVAALVMAASAALLRSSALDRRSSAPGIDRSDAAPVRVVPVPDLDAPLLKLGSRRQPGKLPGKWAKPAAGPRADERAHVSPQAGKTEKDIPAPGVEVADAGAPAAPDAEAATPGETPIETADAGPSANGPVEGHEQGVPEGTETDPLKARAVDVYRARIIAWFSSRFRVRGSGLPQQVLTSLRAPATVQLSADRRVMSYTLTPSGNAAFDAAARSALESTRGAQIPPPPENYPDVVQTQISLTFICKEGRCD